MQSLRWLALLLLGTLVACGGSAAPAGGSAPTSASSAAPAPTSAAGQPTPAAAVGAGGVPEGLTAEGYHVLGRSDALVTMTFYSDFF